MHVNLDTLRAKPMEPCLTFWLSPSESINIDRALFEQEKANIRNWCIDLPLMPEGSSWVTLSAYTGGNGTLARLLIVLGDFLGIWEMQPKISQTGIWAEMLHPMAVEKVRAPIFSNEKVQIPGKICTFCFRPIEVRALNFPDDVCRDCENSGKMYGDLSDFTD